MYQRETSSFARVLGFLDAIYGFAVTLLVVNLDATSPEAWRSIDAFTAHGRRFEFVDQLATDWVATRINKAVTNRVVCLDGFLSIGGSWLNMKIVVLGATGTIGAKITTHLQAAGHEVVQASRSRGVDAATGKGLHEAFSAADAVIDCLNIPTFKKKQAVSFFSRTAHNVVKVARRAGIAHVLCVGIAGATDEKVNAANGYYKGKAVQEKIYRSSGLPVTIIHSTQWFELIDDMVRRVSFGPITVLPTMRMAPIAADSAARFVAECAVGQPPNGARQVAIRGPEITTGIEMARMMLAACGRVGGRHPRVLQQLPLLGEATATGGLIPQEAYVDDLTLEAWLGMSSTMS